MSYWMAKLKDGMVLDGRVLDWTDVVKEEIVVLYLRIGDQTVTLPRQSGGFFFQYKASRVTAGPEGHERLYQVIGCTYSPLGDCIVIYCTEDGDILVGKDNVHDMRTFDDVGHINFSLHDIQLQCNH